MPTGLLRFTVEQIRALNEERLERLRWETVTWLREHCREKTTRLKDSALYATVEEAERSALRMGLRRGASLQMWAWFWVTQDGQIDRDAQMCRFMTDPRNGETVDDRLDSLWAQTENGFNALSGER